MHQCYIALQVCLTSYTCFFTTHRYDTIRRADTILVLMEGFIEEVGTPKNLESNA